MSCNATVFLNENSHLPTQALVLLFIIIRRTTEKVTVLNNEAIPESLLQIYSLLKSNQTQKLYNVIQREINKSIITTCHVKKSFKLTKYKFWLSSSHWCANRLQHTNNVDKYTNGRNKKVAEDDVEHNKVDSIFDLKVKIGKM